jgi:hypothetical protein
MKQPKYASTVIFCRVSGEDLTPLETMCYSFKVELTMC